ncbi:hypothetical protein KY289_028075 [Solanum tuberosum]|nr:hypothetical protein KY289_028075 [Solanum tuberosum]
MNEHISLISRNNIKLNISLKLILEFMKSYTSNQTMTSKQTKDYESFTLFEEAIWDKKRAEETASFFQHHTQTPRAPTSSKNVSEKEISA